MKRHSFKFVLGAASLGVLAVVLFLAWHVGVPLIFGYHAAAPNAKPKAVDFNNPKQILAEADRYAWVFNSQEAGLLYARAEQLFIKSGDEADEIHARVGLIRARAETMSFVDISQFLGDERADREAIGRHEFCMSPEIKHHLGRDIGETCRRGWRITKPYDVRILRFDIEAPRSFRPKHLLAPHPERCQELASDVFPAGFHHLVEDGVAAGF